MQSQESLKEGAKVIYAAISIFFHWGTQTVRKAEWSLTVKWHQFFLQNIELYSAFIRIADDRKLQIIYSHFETI